MPNDHQGLDDCLALILSQLKLEGSEFVYKIADLPSVRKIDFWLSGRSSPVGLDVRLCDTGEIVLDRADRGYSRTEIACLMGPGERRPHLSEVAEMAIRFAVGEARLEAAR